MGKKKLLRDPLKIETVDGLEIKRSQKLRAEIKQHYVEKFFNKFMNKFIFDGLDYQQIRFMMIQFWKPTGGSNAFYKLPMTETELHPQGELIITPWAPNGVWNIYNFPTECTLINTRGVPFIPSRSLKIDEEVVIGYINKNHKGIYCSISEKIDELVDIDMAIRGNLKGLKTPWIVGVSPENKKAVDKFIQGLEDDDPYLFLTIDDLQNAKTLVSGAPLYIDKFEVKRQQVEDEINTILGFNSVGIMNKKEHLTVGEVDMTSEDSSANNDIYFDSLVEIFDRVKKVLGYEVKVSMNKPEMIYNEMGEEASPDEEEEVEDE